ncbi:MAG: hypothetical protein HYX52_06065 [Chloroflexi bacterium]|nr:hypothetical protein [Chloroflexota bacterium]
MSGKASHKSKGGDKQSSDKNTFNPTHEGGHIPGSQTNDPEAMDVKNRDSQGGGMGEAHLIKK